jgi:type II secretory pathway predicted ATPase ExeA/LysM repeat protein
MMYCKHFGLWGAPFTFTPARSQFFPSKPHREGLAALEWGLVHEPSGFTLLVGEPGAGKTTLIGRILADYSQRIRCVTLSNPRLTPEEILRSILDQLNVFPKSLSKLDLLYGLESYLNGLRAGQSIIIVIDEAQDLSDDALEEVRLLSNLGSSEEKQLRFLLVGQQELSTRLVSPGLRQLNERIGARAILNALQPDDGRRYIDYLLASKGGSRNSIFEPKAIDHLIQHSGGIPRRINILCHNALVNAYSNGSKRVTLDIARKTVVEGENILTTATPFDGSKTANQSPMRRARILLLPTAAIAALAVFALGARHLPPLRLAAGTPKDKRGDASHRQAAGPVEPQKVSVRSDVPLQEFSDPVSFPKFSELTSLKQSPQLRRSISVRSGDTLQSIAVRQLGSDLELPRLIRANPQLKNIDVIYPGETVYLPNPDEVTQTEQLP